MSEPTPDNAPPPDLWARADTVFAEALEQPAAQRAAFVRAACGADQRLFSRVLGLLESVADTEGFLEDPAALLQPALEDLFTGDGVERDAAPEGSDPEVSLLVGPYRLVRRIGRGGTGTVYLGERVDGLFSQAVAVKVVRRGLDSEDVLRRFNAERRILASLRHPGIARLLDGGALPDGRPYMVMEYLEGLPITTYCDRHGLRLRERLELFGSIARIVDYAHRNLVVHRDIKPSNILVTTEGEPKLLDFGIAKLFEDDSAGAEATTGTGQVMTPAFASPEQLQGLPITTATDVYQLGLLLYLLVTGSRPFPAASSSPSSLSRSDPTAEPEPPSARLRMAASGGRELRRQIRGDLDTVVMRCLRPDPANRYPSAAAVADDVDRFLSRRPIQARRPGLAYRARKFAARRPAMVAALAVALVAAAGYVASLQSYARRLQAERDQVHLEERRATAVSDFLIDIFSADYQEGPAGDTLTARAVLETGVRRVRTELSDDPGTRAALLLSFGRAYHNLGGGVDGLELVEEAWRLLVGLYGESDPRAVAALEELARGRMISRHYAEARLLLDRAIALRQERAATDTAALATDLRRLGIVLAGLGEPDSALAAMDHAQALRSGGDAIGRATDLRDRGRLLTQLDDHHGAAEAYGEALRMLRQAEANDPRLLIDALHGRGIALRRTGHPSRAEPLYREALDLQRATYGRSHPTTVSLLGSFAWVLHDLGQHTEAELLLRERLEARRSTWGEESWQAGGALGDLGAHFLDRGDPGRAEVAFRESGRIYALALGSDHSYVGNARMWTGRALAAAGRLAEAEAEMRAGVTLLEDSPHDAARRWLPAARQDLLELTTARAPPDR